MRLGNRSYVFTLVLLSSLAAIVVVPAWLAILSPLFPAERLLTSGEVARVLALSFLLPLLAGMVFRALWPSLSEAWSDKILSTFGVVLLGAALLLIGINMDQLVSAGWLQLGTLLLFSVLALAVGHLLGGPDPADRTALAVICSTRHIGIVALLASAVPGPRTLVLLLTYLFVASLVALPYLAWRQRELKAT